MILHKLAEEFQNSVYRRVGPKMRFTIKAGRLDLPDKPPRTEDEAVVVRPAILAASFPFFTSYMAGKDRDPKLHERATEELLVGIGCEKLLERKKHRTADFVHHELKTIIELKTRSKNGRSMDDALETAKMDIMRHHGLGTTSFEAFHPDVQARLEGLVLTAYKAYITSADEQIGATRNMEGMAGYSGGLFIGNPADFALDLSPLMHMLAAYIGNEKSAGRLHNLDYVVYDVFDLWVDTPYGRTPGFIFSIPASESGRATATMLVDMVQEAQASAVQSMCSGLQTITNTILPETHQGKELYLRGYRILEEKIIIPVELVEPPAGET